MVIDQILWDVVLKLRVLCLMHWDVLLRVSKLRGFVSESNSPPWAESGQRTGSPRRLSSPGGTSPAHLGCAGQSTEPTEKHRMDKTTNTREKHQTEAKTKIQQSDLTYAGGEYAH